MTRGLVIGKFLPVHNGHIALIRFAATQCDQLVISMSYRDDDPIPMDLRLGWLQKIFESDAAITVKAIKDDFDNEALPWDQRTKVWADVIQRIYGRFDILVSSEEYGPYFAGHMEARHIDFDRERKNVPVSASLIRSNPFRQWEHIPPVVRPFFVKKVCFYGPESTGKTVMAEKMAKLYETDFVPEVARELIETNDFTLSDIERIGRSHYQRIEDKLESANKVLFVDTDAITTQIYSMYYLNNVPSMLYELEKKITFDHYFLFDIDVPWVSDGLRDLGQKREELFQIFAKSIEHRSIPYTQVKGTWAQREEIIIRGVDALLLR